MVRSVSCAAWAGMAEKAVRAAKANRQKGRSVIVKARVVTYGEYVTSGAQVKEGYEGRGWWVPKGARGGTHGPVVSDATAD